MVDNNQVLIEILRTLSNASDRESFGSSKNYRTFFFTFSKLCATKQSNPMKVSTLSQSISFPTLVSLRPSKTISPCQSEAQFILSLSKGRPLVSLRGTKQSHPCQSKTLVNPCQSEALEDPSC